MIEVVGEISLEVIELLNLPLSKNTPIYAGKTNVAHMARKHGYEFNRFFDRISQIIATAEYVRLKENDGSIEYIKFLGKHIKLAVRIAGDGNYYLRSLYFMEEKRIKNLIKNNELKPLTKQQI